MEIVAEAIHDFPVICGSAAIAEELPKFWPATKVNSVLESLDIKDNNKVMVVSGSLTRETKEQTNYLITNGMQIAVFDSRKIFNEVEAQSETTRIVDKAKDSIINGEDLLVMAGNNDNVVAQ